MTSIQCYSFFVRSARDSRALKISVSTSSIVLVVPHSTTVGDCRLESCGKRCPYGMRASDVTLA